MRPISLLLIMLAASLSACGGGGDASSTRPSPPPPPPPPAPVTPVPTTLVVSAGADQTVEPLSLLATRPVFLVRDASGQAMAGVDVSFAVDSGGGTLDGPTTARTGADGSVAAPPWRAGEREGVQVLLARVGSTLSARVRATARFATVSITPIAVPTAGGTIRFARAGLPLDGFAVQLPRDAFSTNATTLGLALESAAGLPLPDGSVARSPAVRLVPTGGTQRKAVAATFPLTDADTGIVVVVGRPVGTTGWRVLPTLGASRTALTVSVPVELAPPATNALRGLVAQVDPAPVKPSIDIMLLLRLDRRLLQGDFRTTFRPGLDEWAMLPLNTYGASTAGRPTERLYQSLLVAPAFSAVHYFLYGRANSGFPLSRVPPAAAGVLRSHRKAYLLNSAVEANAPDVTEALGVDAFLLASLATDRRRLAEQSYLAIKAMLSLSRLAPQVGGLFGRVVGGGRSVQASTVIIGTVDSTVIVTNPLEPGDSLRLTLGPNGFRPVTARASTGADVEFDYVGVMPLGASYFDAYLTALFLAEPDVIARSERWPTVRLMSEAGELDPQDVILFEPLRHWWECPQCEDSQFRVPAVPGRPVLPAYRAVKEDGGSWPQPTDVVFTQRLTMQSLGPSGRLTLGMQLIQPAGVVANEITSPHWLEWKEIRYRKLLTALTPRDSLIATTDTTVTFRLAVTDPPPRLRYRWRLKAAQDDSTITTSPVYERRLTAPTEGWMIVTVLQGDSLRPIGRDSVFVRVREASVGLTPSPLIGGYGVGYTLRATPSGPVPSTARYRWSRGDGSPDTTTATGQLVLRYAPTAGRPLRTFPVTVQLRDGDRTLATGRTTAEIGRGFPVWRVTAVELNESESGTGALDGGGFYADNLAFYRSFWSTVQGGARQGGLLFIERDTVLADGVSRPRGVYSIEADSLTPARINETLRVPTNINTFFTSVQGVRGVWQLHPFLPARRSTNDASFDERFASTVNWVTGTVDGVLWQEHVPEAQDGVTYRFPRAIRRVSATFSDSTASATFEYIYRNHSRSAPRDRVEQGRRTLRVTVRGVRIK